MTAWTGSRGTKCPKCGGGVCSELHRSDVAVDYSCELCGHAWGKRLWRVESEPVGINPALMKPGVPTPIGHAPIGHMWNYYPDKNAPGCISAFCGACGCNGSSTASVSPCPGKPTPSPGIPVAVNHTPTGIVLTPGRGAISSRPAPQCLHPAAADVYGRIVCLYCGADVGPALATANP